jgi:hypothetical protein
VMARQEASTHFSRDSISVKCLRPLGGHLRSPVRRRTSFHDRPQTVKNPAFADR